MLKEIQNKFFRKKEEHPKRKHKNTGKKWRPNEIVDIWVNIDNVLTLSKWHIMRLKCMQATTQKARSEKWT